MAPEPVLPSPPSDGGLLRGEEVIHDEILGVVAKGGKVWYYHCIAFGNSFARGSFNRSRAYKHVCRVQSSLLHMHMKFLRYDREKHG